MRFRTIFLACHAALRHPESSIRVLLNTNVFYIAIAETRRSTWNSSDV